MKSKNLFSLKNAEQVRRSVTRKQQKKIRRMYADLYEQVQGKIKTVGENKLKKQNLFVIRKMIEDNIRALNNDLEKDVISNMTTVCNSVVEDTRSYLKRCGFDDIQDAFIYVPRQVVTSIKTGAIYQEGWTLSKAIWGYNKGTQSNLNRIIAIDTAQGKSAFKIAKDIESYVNPSARNKSRTISSWRYDKNGNKIHDVFRFGKVDYNAQRLARTLTSHAYQQAFEMVNRDDPFVIGYRWLTSNFHGRVCEICRDRAETDSYGLGIGVFPKGELPLDHPNGMCTFEVVFDKTPKQIGELIDKWYESPIGTYPEIDKFASTFLE